VEGREVASKKILPGLVSDATNLIEHPEPVADRISRFIEGADATM
jgi:methionine synthase II (cobalamin-independent)